MQVMRPPRVYDVAIIGSGAAGGMTAHVLTREKFDVVMLEAGPLRNLAELPNDRYQRWDLPFRGLRGEYFREWFGTPGFLVDESKEPYAWANEDWMQWTRIRAVGGKSLFWAGHTPRMGPNEFQPDDDFDTAWPIAYEDIAPYYDRVEEMIGVTSSGEAVPGFPLNKGLPPLKPRCSDIELTTAAQKIGRGLKVLPLPKAITTTAHHGRPACHYCGHCWRGCDIGSKFDSLRVFVEPALRSGRLTLLSNARVRSVEMGKEGRVIRAYYFDSVQKTYKEIRAHVFVLAAGCIESTQIVLNSEIANTSGLVGHYLSEHMSGLGIGGFLPQVMGRRIVNEDGTGYHSFIPNLTPNWRKDKFIRGYQIYLGGGISETTLVGKRIPGFGDKWKKHIRDYYTAGVSVYFQGEVLSYKDNHIEVDEDLKDDAEIPGVRFHYSWRENERAMFLDMMDVGEEILRAAGAEYSPPDRDRKLDTYGRSIHYLGTMRMGRDPKASVVNHWHQFHDVPNLFVNDSAVFVNAGNQNPTLTSLALALRASEWMAESMRKGEI